MAPTDGIPLLVATSNPGKLVEMRELLGKPPWQIEGLPADAPEFEETGSTFAENARAKALFRSGSTDVPVIADDSGLVIDALGGEPGIHSARYLDPEMAQTDRNRAVIAKLAGMTAEERTARFVCHLVLAYRGEIIHETVGTCEGLIAERERGRDGFGYDPIFLVPDLDLTFAEIPAAEKDARSHRGIAAREMEKFLASWRPPGA
jgi:XTP/dITP diphosphohydrolase